MNEKQLREKATAIKCARIAEESYGRKKYIEENNISDTRECFRARFGLSDFAGNYSHNPKFAKSDWLCQCKQSTESESHLLTGTCKVYGDLKNGFGNLEEDMNLLQFFRAVLDRRDSLENDDSVFDTLGASSVLRLPGTRTRRPGDHRLRAD